MYQRNIHVRPQITTKKLPASLKPEGGWLYCQFNSPFATKCDTKQMAYLPIPILRKN
jgi:hypothetical protein